MCRALLETPRKSGVAELDARVLTIPADAAGLLGVGEHHAEGDVRDDPGRLVRVHGGYGHADGSSARQLEANLHRCDVGLLGAGGGGGGTPRESQIQRGDHPPSGLVQGR